MELNTSHPLYSNLKLLIGVDEGNALVDLVTPSREFTPHASSTFGAGTYGRHFGARRGNSTTPYGASFTPNFQPANNTGTLVVVTNAIHEATAHSHASIIGPGVTTTSVGRLPRLASAASGGKAVFGAYSASTGTTQTITTSADYVSAAPTMWAVTRESGGSAASYINGVADTTGTIGSNDTASYFAYIGGASGYAAVSADIVWVAWFDVVLTAGQISDLYASLGADNAFALVSSGGGGDTTAPTLTSPTGTATGATTASGTVSTDEGNGTLYYLASTNASESATTVKAASSQAVSATGSQSVSFAGLTASTTYYAHYVHRDAAGNDSTVASSASFTTSAAGDTTPPTLTGSITISALTTTSYTASWPAGSDDTAVTGYEYRIASGSWIDAGNVLTVDITGRTPGATETFEVRAYDAVPNYSSALSTSVTLNSATATVTVTEPLKNNTGTLLASQSGITASVLSASTLASVHTATGLTTNASGVLAAISNASITTGQQYHVAIKLADGGVGITGPITAS